MDNASYFQNRACEYFPCHKGADPENFNCLFCFCPLYALGERCGGNFTYTSTGYKDCSACMRPHKAENYGDIMKALEEVLDMGKKPAEPEQSP